MSVSSLKTTALMSPTSTHQLITIKEHGLPKLILLCYKKKECTSVQSWGPVTICKLNLLKQSCTPPLSEIKILGVLRQFTLILYIIPVFACTNYRILANFIWPMKQQLSRWQFQYSIEFIQFSVLCFKAITNKANIANIVKFVTHPSYSCVYLEKPWYL